MANEIVKYHNHMNEVCFRKFTSVELDLFFSICYQMKEKQLDIIQFSFDEIKKLAKIDKNYTIDNFYNLLKSMYKKLISLTFAIEHGSKYTEFVLFTQYEIDTEEQTIDIAINQRFSYILNDLTSNFTRFELEEFTKLRSSYSKQMFKLLAQFKSTGFFIVSIDDFKIKLDVPNSYRMSDINRFVLNPIMIELKFYFKGLKLEKIKKGRSIDKLKFTFHKIKTFDQFEKGKKISFDMVPQIERLEEVEEKKEEEGSREIPVDVKKILDEIRKKKLM